ncbi:MAG TPA: hypothetical protein VJV78_11845, partial [Polyangiales bacterium]|nr:hypothetical protein [Polyangiales bacterium]
PVAVAAESAPVAAPSRAGFEALAGVGYGLITEVQRIQMQPYAASFGLDLGYTFEFGLHLGAKLSYGLGQQKEQTYESMGRQRQMTIDSNAVSTFLSVGYDLWLHFLILRYSLGIGATFLNWELGNIQGSFEGYTAPTGSVTSFVLVPGLLLLWPIKAFEIGLGFDYFFQADVQTPSGIVTQLVLGVKL